MTTSSTQSRYLYVRVPRAGHRSTIHEAGCRTISSSDRTVPWAWADGMTPGVLLANLRNGHHEHHHPCEVCFPTERGHRPVQLELDDARTGAVERDRAMDRTAATASAEHIGAIDDAIRMCAATGEPFSANDVRPYLPADAPRPLVGTRFMAAHRRGLIVRVGDTPSSDVATHAHRISLWKKATA